MKVWKLTDEKGQTYRGCQWGEGIEHTTSGKGDLCTAGWLHAYADPLLAVLLNPVHANFASDTMQLWEAEGEGVQRDHCGLKLSFLRLRTLRRVELPQISTEQRVRFAILCTREVYNDSKWVHWAEKWLSDQNRPAARAEAAEAEAAAEAAAAGSASAGPSR